MHSHNRFSTVVVVRIDHGKRLVQNLLARKNRLTGSPRLFPVCGKRFSFGDVFKRLERIRSLHACLLYTSVLTPLDADSYVSMNMWGLTPEFIGMLEKGFTEFFRQGGDMTKREYLLPIFIGELLQQHAVSVRVLRNDSTTTGLSSR